MDFHWMSVSPDVESGDYNIAVGLYDESSGERWPVLRNSEQPGGDQIMLTEINLSMEQF